MGLIIVLATAIIVAYIVAVFFTMNSNYMDTNINPLLNITNFLKLKGTFTEDDIKVNNDILRSHLSIATKIAVITDQMEKFNKNRKKTPNIEEEPQQQPPPAVSSTEETHA